MSVSDSFSGCIGVNLDAVSNFYWGAFRKIEFSQANGAYGILGASELLEWFSQLNLINLVVG
jgi:hypothetical protein